MLSWWQRLLGMDGTDDWHSAVEDIVWVLEKVLKSQTNANGKHIHNDILSCGSKNGTAGHATESSDAFNS